MKNPFDVEKPPNAHSFKKAVGLGDPKMATKNPPLRKSQNNGKVDLKHVNYSTTKDVLEQNVD